jgi:hypothetical protein
MSDMNLQLKAAQSFFLMMVCLLYSNHLYLHRDPRAHKASQLPPSLTEHGYTGARLLAILVQTRSTLSLIYFGPLFTTGGH